MKDEETGEPVLEISLSGPLLLDYPLFNKGSAFTDEERREFGLLGLLPPHVSTIDEQMARIYENYNSKQTDLDRYIFLVALQDRNETLFYRTLEEHITEMMPIIYTPVVGAASQHYSHIYRRPRGLYISYPHRGEIDQILDNAPYRDIDVIVVTDGERILGLGDLGVGGMGIPVGKLSLYSVCAGIHPAATLPVFLDVGTDNQSLLDDSLYLGWRHERVRGAEYDDFINSFVESVKQKFPGVLLQWEDFSRSNARRLLDRYKDEVCSFNDDIQGTGAVTLAGLLSAVKAVGTGMSEHRTVIFGAGSAGTGVADQIVSALKSEGLSEEEARARIWMIDVAGLLYEGRGGLEPFNEMYAQPIERVQSWEVERPGHIPLEDVVRNVRPTILIGTAAQPGAFTREIVTEMASHVERPIIFPLSNPTSKSEAAPSDLIYWTDARALVATGSPFPPVLYKGDSIRIGQCNNVYIFPGVGLGVLASGARRVSDEMFLVAARALREMSPVLRDPRASLYPALEDVREVSRAVAVEVGLEAQREGLADKTSREEMEQRVKDRMWSPRYMRYRQGRG
ncbi:MAG TPA: NAD-dependent malic enzyme [Blastocatellia bacterium]|nr:NAD-dependent malic enzyme [Blastocatellia bacterium]